MTLDKIHFQKVLDSAISYTPPCRYGAATSPFTCLCTLRSLFRVFWAIRGHFKTRLFGCDYWFACERLEGRQKQQKPTQQRLLILWHTVLKHFHNQRNVGGLSRAMSQFCLKRSAWMISGKKVVYHKTSRSEKALTAAGDSLLNHHPSPSPLSFSTDPASPSLPSLLLLSYSTCQS